MENNKNTQYELNKGLAQMLKGGVIMDVTTPEQARIAEAAGACAVMALERIPADIRAAGGVSRMSDPKMIKGIQEAVSIPVMAKCRIGHFVEAQILEAIEIDYIDESEVLSPADDVYHINKRDFKVPFVCGARDLGEALRRINEGASMIRTKGEPGTGDVVQAVRHMRKMNQEIARLTSMREDELFQAAKELQVPYELVAYVHENGKLPVVNFAAGGVATPADAALMMQLGAEGVFVGSGIFKSGDPKKRAAAIVKAVTNFNDAKMLAEQGKGAEEIKEILEKEKFESSIYIMVDTLEYLKKGGRITPAAAALGTLLKLKPVLQIQGEKLDAFAKARTVKQAKSIMIDAMKSDFEKRFNNPDGSQINLEMAYTHDIAAAETFKEEVQAAFPNNEIVMNPLSLSVSCHIGPGALAIACSKKIEYCNK